MYPAIHLNLPMLEHNARTLTTLCRSHGLELMAVTKGVGAIPEVAKAFLAGGATALADSRLQNIQRLRSAGVECPLWLLRSPALSEAAACAALATGSFNSQWPVLERLNAEASQRRLVHQVYLMVEMGDLREGLLPQEAASMYQACLQLPAIEVVGISANLACFAGVKPTGDVMAELAALARELQGSRRLKISAGNSSALHLMAQGGWEGPWTSAMDHLRVGESLLFGWDVFTQEPLDGFSQDTCFLRAEVIEVEIKPSRPKGPRGSDAFGEIQHFPDRGLRRRALASVGKQDFGAGHLRPIQSGIEVVGATSDHLVLDVEENPEIEVGTMLDFTLDYGSLLALTTSRYVEVSFCGRGDQ